MATYPIDQLSAPWSVPTRWRELLVWVGISIALYALGSVGAWLVDRLDNQKTLKSHLVAKPWQDLALWMAYVGWLVVPGYVALLQGVLSPRLMGLTQVDLGVQLGYGALFMVAATGILLAVGLTYRRQRLLRQPYPSVMAAISLTTRLIVEAGALQWHWAFYRTAMIEALASSGLEQAVYWGTWLSVLIVCMEGSLNPNLWKDLRTPGRAERRILRGVLLIVTSVLYLISRNFWLAWALHGLTVAALEPRLTAGVRSISGTKEGSRRHVRRRQP